MRPMTTEMRQELGAAHPHLTKPQIEEFEGLLAWRASVDAATDPERAAAIDAQILELVRRMPTKG